MKAVTGLRHPTSGQIRLFGSPYERRLLTQVGALLESLGLWPQLDATAHLRIHARLRGVPETRISEVLSLMNLTEVSTLKVAKYSLGMRWRLGIAIALLGRPRLVILDEPMNGLDPVGIRDMRATLRSLTATGATVMVSSHRVLPAGVPHVETRHQVRMGQPARGFRRTVRLGERLNRTGRLAA